MRDEPIRARPIGFGERGWRWLRKQGRSVVIIAGGIAATAALALLVAAFCYNYSQWRTGYLAIGTDQPGLVAEVLDAGGDAAAPPRTLPTTEPVKLAAGDYRLRVSGKGRISQTFAVNVPRGEKVDLLLNLEDQLLWPSQEIERSFALVQIDGLEHRWFEDRGSYSKQACRLLRRPITV